MKRSDFTARQLPSGFWAVWYNGMLINAALVSESAADEYIDRIVVTGILLLSF